MKIEQAYNYLLPGRNLYCLKLKLNWAIRYWLNDTIFEKTHNNQRKQTNEKTECDSSWLIAYHANDIKYVNWTTYLGDNTQFLVFPCLSLKTSEKVRVYVLVIHFYYSREKGCGGSRTTEQGSKLSEPLLPFLPWYKTDHNTGNNMPYSFTTCVCVFFLRPTGL